jgi:outer membrane protein assembly factor BamB
MRNAAHSLTHRLAGLMAAGALLGALGCEGDVAKVWQYTSHSASRSTPALLGEIIVFGTESGELHAVDVNGSYRWKFPAGKEIVSAPAVVEDMLLFGSTNSNLYAVAASGRQVFKYTTFARIKGDPLVVDNSVVFGSYDKHLYRIGLDDQKEMWTFPPDIVDGQLLDAPKKPEDWKEGDPEPAWDTKLWPTEGFSYAKPLRTSTGLIVSGNLDGYLYALDEKTGELKWRWASDGVKEKGAIGITSSVREHEGVIYYGANDGNVYAMDLKNRKILWKFKTGDEVNSSAAIDAQNGVLYIGSRDKKLYALGLKDGAKKWEFTANGPILGIPALYKNLVIFGGGKGDGHVYALNTKDGSVFWKFKTGGEVDADPLFNGDTFYIASADRNLYAFQIKKTPQ